MLRTTVALAACTLCTAILIASPQQSPPQFRAGVDIVLIDVTVLDKAGQPIPDLSAADFILEVAGKKRPVVHAQYVVSGRQAALRAGRPAGPVVQLQTSPLDLSVAALATESRSLFVVVDVENIRAGDGRGAMESLADYFDTLPGTDQIGMVAYPWGTPSVALTGDRSALRAGLLKTVGTSHQLHSCDPTFGEAAATASDAWAGRVANYGCRTNSGQMGMAQLVYRRQTQNLLKFATEMSQQLAARPGRRAIILVSEGLYIDDEVRGDLKDFGTAMERSRVVFHAIHLDFPFNDASTKQSISPSRHVDDREGFGAMAESSYVTGGETIRAISRPTAAIRRIDTALSGSYILAFDRIESDKDGKRLGLKIDVTRKGADVRTRTHVTVNPK